MGTELKKYGKGCLKVFVWILLIFSIMMVMGGILAINEQPAQEKENAETMNSETVDKVASVIALLFMGGLTVGCIFVLIKLRGKGQLDYKIIETQKEIANKESNPIKKKILNDHIGFLIQKDIEQRLKPLVKKYEDKVTKNPKQEWIQLLQKYGEELNKAQIEVENLRYDIVAELSDSEKEKYKELCDSFKILQKSKRIWVIKNSDKTSCFFKCGSYKELSIPYDVPKMPLYYRKTLYFYPRYVIVDEGKTFNAFPISKITLTHAAVSIPETGFAPSDAVKVGTTYRYVNKKGEPDGRYKNNPTIQVMQYGALDFTPLDITLVVSNNNAAEKFGEAFQLLQDATMKQQKINISPNRVSRTLYNNYNSVVSQIVEMADWMKNSAEFKTVLKKQNIKLTYNEKNTTRTSDLVNTLIEIDFLNCFLKLGKYLDFDDSECFGLFMLYAALNNQITIDYGQIDAYKDKYSSTVSDIYFQLKNAIEHNPTPEGGFVISLLLGETDKNMQHKYLMALHLFATSIANIDNKISDEEQKGLDFVSSKLNDADISDNEGNVESEKESKKFKKKIDIDKACEELQKLIGLQSVKSEIETLANFIKIQQTRAEKGIKTPSVSYHCVFTGNPGTGKTTVARIVAGIYKELGILKKGHLVETDRSGLVAEYVGQTAPKTNKVIDSALDGILFIDEAYSLVSGGQNDFGIEAIATLLKRMEDDRDRLVVILAGYSNEMQTFINANPGLQSRFNRYIDFPDYSASELMQIFEFNLKKNEYCISDEARTALAEYLQKCVNEKDERFGNGRFVRNLFEKTIERQANRLSQAPNLTAEMLTTIEVGDLPE